MIGGCDPGGHMARTYQSTERDEPPWDRDLRRQRHVERCLARELAQRPAPERASRPSGLARILSAITSSAAALFEIVWGLARRRGRSAARARGVGDERAEEQGEAAPAGQDPAEVLNPGIRPPRTDDPIIIGPPDDALPTRSGDEINEIPHEVWLYASGGGLRSPQATLGAAWYLDRIGHWQRVTRIISVSGGAIANAEFAQSAVRGGPLPANLLGGFHRRMITPQRWLLTLLVTSLLVLGVIAGYGLWRTNPLGQWLADQAWFRIALLITLGIAVVGTTIWLAIRRRWMQLVLFLLIVGAMALGGILLWQWSTLPGWVRSTVVTALVGVIVAALVIWWLLSRPNFGRWMSAVVMAAIGVAFLWFLLWKRDLRLEWQWLAWMLTVVLLAAVALLYLAVVQLGFRLYLNLRLRAVLGPNLGNLEAVGARPDATMAHVFTTVDAGSGQPVHVTAGPPGGPQQAGAVAIHDMSGPANAVHYFDADGQSLHDTVYASAALPALVLPHRWELQPAFPANPPALTPAPGVVMFGQAQGQHPPLFAGALVDGGLSSTFATSLDPVLSGLIDVHGTMQAIDVLYPATNGFDPDTGQLVPNANVRRVVVDGGQFLEDHAWIRLVTVAGVSAILTLLRGLNIANLSLLKSERLLVDRDVVDIWYVPATGGDRTFRLIFSPDAAGEIGALQPGVTPTDKLQIFLARNRQQWITNGATPEQVAIAQSIDRVMLLKERTDRLSLWSGISEYGHDALASGVASTFVEHRGIDTDPVPLEQELLDLDQELLADEFDVVPARQNGRRLPMAICHQGRSGNLGGNTAAAFHQAVIDGFRMLEVDVMRTADEDPQNPGNHVLVTMHPGNPLSARQARSTAFADIPGHANVHDRGGFAQLRWILDPNAHAAALPQGAAADLAGIFWNIEAKDRASARAVAALLNDLPADVSNRVLFSGGWRVSAILAFRNALRDRDVLIACHWWDVVRLSLGFNSSEPRVLQPPVERTNRWLRFGPIRRRLRRAVREARARGMAVIWFQVDDEDEAIELRSLVPCHGYMTEGIEVLAWANQH